MGEGCACENESARISLSFLNCNEWIGLCSPEGSSSLS